MGKEFLCYCTPPPPSRRERPRNGTRLNANNMAITTQWHTQISARERVVAVVFKSFGVVRPRTCFFSSVKFNVIVFAAQMGDKVLKLVACVIYII